MFRNRVLEFAQEYWSGANPNEITIERMAGGGYNRIIGLSRKAGGQTSPDQYILRIPRFDAAQVDDDVAAHRFVRRHTDLPVPNVLAFDRTSNNKLGNPYML